MQYFAPEFNLEAFHCPFCDTYSHMTWRALFKNDRRTNYYEALCSKCTESSLWRIEELEGHIDHEQGNLIFPDNGGAPLPETDMPDNVKKDYLEASSLFSKSPRASAALLRLSLQKLLKHLGQKGENINEDIRKLAKENILPPMVVKVADTVRITGNNAVHPGEMSDKDLDFIASKMFGLLNFIVKKAITEPNELEELYALTPEGPRKSAEKKDAQSQ